MPAAPGRLESPADDDAGRLRAAHRSSSCSRPGCCGPGRSVRNLAPETYTRRRSGAGLPGAGEATELLDFAGRHNLERVPQRAAVPHRHPPAGEPQGPHRRGQRLRAARRHAPASASRPATSGRCTPRGAATTCTTPSGSSPASRLIGGGELLLPGEVRLATGESYASPWVYGVVRRPAWTRSPAASTGTCGPASRGSPPTARSPSTSGRRSTSTTTLDRLLDLAERAAAVGVERYVLDDGWFGSRRDEPSGPRRLGGLPRRLAARPAPAGRPGPQAGHAVRALVRAGDGQPGLRPGPRPPRVDHGGPGRVADRVPQPAGAQPRHPGGLRAREGADPGGPRGIRRSTTSSGTTTGT